MKNTKIICGFNLIGKTYCLENRKDLKILDILFEDIFFEWRKMNDEELEIEKKIWNDVPHLMSGEGYVNLIKDKLIKVRNKDFPYNLIEILNYNMGEVDFILLPTNIEILKALDKENIDYFLIFPSLDSKEEYIGRSFLLEEDNKKSKTKALAFSFDIFIKELLKKSRNKNHFILERGQYLNDIIDRI